MRAAVLLLLAGCGLPAPGPEDLAFVRQIPAPPGPYVRATAVADIEGEKLSGTFDVLLLARTGARPAVRLQLLPDLGGKALDLAASPERLTGRFPHSGEEIDWKLPDDARAHPLLFIAITLLERFAPLTDDRLENAMGVSGQVQGEGPVRRILKVTPVVPGSRSELHVARTKWERILGWGRYVSWTLREHEVRAPGLHLRLRNVKIEPLGALDESLLRLK